MEENELKNVISRSSASFRSLNSELHMVIYFDRCVFDYIPDTREFRPYNTGYWAKIEETKDNECILDFIKSVYDQLKQKDLSNDYIIYGFIMDSIIAMDLNKVIRYLKTMERVDKIIKGLQDPPPSWYNMPCNHNKMLEQCINIQKTLSIEYGFWDHVLNGALYNHDKTIYFMNKYGDEYYRYMNNEENEEDED